MTPIIIQDRYDEIVGNAETQSLMGVWTQLRYDGPEFDRRRDAFLWILESLLREGRIKLHKNGVFLSTEIDDQVEMFRLAFPASEEDADKRCTKPGFEAAYEGFGMNVWWFLDICPAGVAWQMPDGSYQLAD
ncbi:DUF596 domain-containing protein [Variovorax sp. UMC13]|uniref:DUF596 domain-containing protein n=1 Tax=Variovorax sp. UMC13 TaxID=1862326 RepID=UPI001601A8E7|nr:DUF596 domain-containing protein [Variovorax sp. UMC13]MBB1602284.1 hypothetical protein [Variovorax sp. UMC13]